MRVRPSPFSPVFPAQPGDCLTWGHLYGSSPGLVIARSVQHWPGPVIVVTSDTLSAQRLGDEVAFYAGSSMGQQSLSLPDLETLPYDQFSPHQDIVSERLDTLYRLPRLSRGVLITPIQTVMHRLPPRDYIESSSLVLDKGQHIDRESMRHQWESTGYHCVSQVTEHGDFAIRGSLIDIFPMGAAHPYRIDLFDDEVETLRVFDTETQRSFDQVERIHLLPGREYPLTKTGITRFREQWRMHFEGNPNTCPVYQDVSEGHASAGLEYYLPLFYESMATLFDYLPVSSLIIMMEGVAESADIFWDEIQDRYEQLRHDRRRPLLPASMIFLNKDDVDRACEGFSRVNLHHMAQEAGNVACNFATAAPPSVPIDSRADEPLSSIREFISDFAGRVLFVAETSGRRETLLDIFTRHGLKPVIVDSWQSFLHSDFELGMTVASLERGLEIRDPAVAVIAESQMFGDRVMQRRLRKRSRRDPENVIRDLTELTIDAPVIHEEHGVGRYRGLYLLQVSGVEAEFIGLEYADGDKLYVPVSSLHYISRYCGIDPDHAPLHKLGSGQWQKARRKAAQKVYDIAAELLAVHARRAARQGHAYRMDQDAYQAFVQDFPFEETPDQQLAIEQVLSDMQEGRPMDRLVCGDAGFGKTEVALRAAFSAAQDGKQVAVLVPTTLLAQQHYQNFKDRFANWPVNVEQASRFRSKQSLEKISQGLSAGQIDIIIGTHKLLQGDVEFKRLGLVIIDEEHRFGVRQKERFKALRANVDVLTLSATPIPRTLNLALSGMRDLSVIATPPVQRIAVKTFVREWNDTLVREAVLREIHRGGQVFFLHNKVENIDNIAAKIQALIPGCKVEIAHGQMREKELERVMMDFYHRRFNVLVCTTIIETGIDVPTANTILINRADRFGLAQLYQLRGRVGRSHHQAYAYLIVPPRRQMTADAIKRLEAIEALEELGVGFTLAMHDLEIRGSGEILGEEQSGHIQAIGFGLYTAMLEQAVMDMKAGREPDLDRPLDHGTEIDLQVPALLTEDYLPDVHMRLIMYKRIASVENRERLRDLQVEMIDRFGLLPEPAKTLIKLTELKLKAEPLGIRKIELASKGGRLIFHDHPNIDPNVIICLIQARPNVYRLDGNNKLRITMDMPEADVRIRVAESLLDDLTTRHAA